MKQSINLRRASLLVFFIMAVPLAAFSFSDQTTSERILRENKNFVHFIDTCLTNFAEDKTGDFQKAYGLHFNADVSYLQADYRRTYKKIRASQEVMTTLYSDVVKNVYLEGSKDVLDEIAPNVIRSKNAKARLFLNLGYRDRTISFGFYTVGEASNPKLYSYKIYKYQKAIKYARRAKRYAFLALFESQNAEMKRKIFMHLLKTENQKGNQFFNRFNDLKEQDYIKEMGKNYEEYEKESRGDKTSDQSKLSASYEKKVEKRVRFRNEKRAARFLINMEFDQAEDIMRRYVEDFNFKLITSTFEVISGGGEGGAGTGTDKGDKSKTDYNAFKVHLMDNYSRLVKSSILESFYGKVTVEDKVDKVQQWGGEEQAEDHTAPEDKDAGKIIDKNPIK